MAINTMRMIVWDVKRGNAISLHLPNGKTVMIDCGNSEECSPVKILSRDFKIKKIDWLVITHPHTDHMADLAEIQKLGMNPTVLTRVTGISETAIKSDNKDQAAVTTYISLDKHYNSSLGANDDPYNPENMGGAQFKCFVPTKCAESDLNNRSLVIVAEYGGTKILFMGDCTCAAQRELLERPDFVKAISGVNIFVAPHHGHESCYCPELVEKLNPWICIASDSKDTQDVSASDLYGKKCIGIMLWDSGEGRVRRLCLTTRKDGHIDITFPVTGGISVKTYKSGLASC